ncbi:bacteriohemerythrin [Halomicroarcula sp. GCM10025324]|uniref:bacteriohemerythrin n=1 Tax=Haloarcula TaxID=2237 RepID=UPI0023E7FD03|nr:bacteriohemerythrin [Halomicroarcula sp. ZS-22-S1]
MDSRSGDTLIEWVDERYSTDIDRFDEQHKHLFGLLNDLYVAVDEGHSEDAVGDILRELERYTEYHFGDEEEFMQDCGYAMDCADCFYDHREMHAEFADQVREFREKHEAGEPITVDVLEFARDWLDAHIAGSDVDQNYGEYYAESVPEDYAYCPGKLNKSRDDDRTYDAPEETVRLGSDVHVGGAVSIPHGSMADWIRGLADRHGDRTAAYAFEDGQFETRTFEELYQDARAVAAGFLDAGVEPGTTLGIRARPSYEWAVVDLACHLAGVVSVPVYSGFDEERAVATETTAGIDALVTDDDPSEAVADAAGTVFDVEDLPTGDRPALPGFEADPDDVATVVHRLGTETDPLGVGLSHQNLLAAVAMLGDQFPVSPGQTGTCSLPLSHVFQRVVTYYLWDGGAAAAYVPNDDLLAGLRLLSPEVLVGVPRVYEHLADSLESHLDALGGVKGRLADGTAVERGQQLAAGASGSLTDTAAERLVFAPLREEFGLENLEYGLSGGDGLDADRLQRLWGCGVPVSEVYGTPELAGVGCVTPSGSEAPAALGSPLPGTEVALADDGEILFRGDHVADRYWETRDVSASTTRGEWYPTGDYGEFDAEGRLHRADRHYSNN